MCAQALYLPRGIFLRKVRKVCVCVCECFECNDALHVGNFLVSCIPIGSSLTRLRQVQNGPKVGGLQLRIARSIRLLPEITPSGQVAFL